MFYFLNAIPTLNCLAWNVRTLLSHVETFAAFNCFGYFFIFFFKQYSSFFYTKSVNYLFGSFFQHFVSLRSTFYITSRVCT